MTEDMILDDCMLDTHVDPHFLPSAEKVGVSLVRTVEQSYVTQFEHFPTVPCVLFSSGRVIRINDLPSEVFASIKPGDPLLGFAKDDGHVLGIGFVEKPALTPAKAFRWLLMLNHLAPLRSFTASFELFVSRKTSLHFLRYAHIATNMRSQKYLDTDQFRYVPPSRMTKLGDKDGHELQYYSRCMRQIQEMHETLRGFGWDAEDARLVMPNATLQRLMWGSTFEGIIKMLDIGAEQYVGEVNEVCCMMLGILQTHYPTLFDVYKWVETPHGMSYGTRKPRSKNVFVNFAPGPEVKAQFGVLPNCFDLWMIGQDYWAKYRDLRPLRPRDEAHRDHAVERSIHNNG